MNGRKNVKKSQSLKMLCSTTYRLLLSYAKSNLPENILTNKFCASLQGFLAGLGFAVGHSEQREQWEDDALQL